LYDLGTSLFSRYRNGTVEFAIFLKQPLPLPHYCEIGNFTSVASAAQLPAQLNVTPTTSAASYQEKIVSSPQWLQVGEPNLMKAVVQHFRRKYVISNYNCL
jgi:hypothetical protein